MRLLAPLDLIGAIQRPDGHVAEGVPAYRRFMPALMPTRTGSTVYLDPVSYTHLTLPTILRV